MFRLKNRLYLITFNVIVSTCIGLLYSYFTKLIYKPTIIMPELFISIFINPSLVHTYRGFLVGNIGSFIVSIFHVFSFVFVLDYTGWRHLWWKSFAVTTTGYILAVGLMYLILGNYKNILSLAIFYSAHLVYLTFSAYFIGKIGVPSNPLE